MNNIKKIIRLLLSVGGEIGSGDSRCSSNGETVIMLSIIGKIITTAN